MAKEAEFSLFLLLISSFCATGKQFANLSGIALDVATKRAIASAKISLCESRANYVVGRCFSTTTNRDGRFAFTDRPVGRYYLSGDAAGYLSDFLILDGQGTVEFDLRCGETRSVRMMLWPEAVVSGRLVDERGRPLSGVNVAAIRESCSFGSRQLTRNQYRGGPSSVSTNSKGEFRIGALTPGKYYLEAFLDALSKPERAVVEKGYVPVYYPGAAYLREATALCLGAGAQHRVEYRVLPRRTFRARGKLIVPRGFKSDFKPVSTLENEYGGLVHHWTREYDPVSKSFVLGQLVPGAYEVEFASGIYDTDLAARLKFTIATAGTEGILLRMQRPFALRANVHLPDGYHPTTSASLRLRLQREREALDGSGWPVIKEGIISLPQLRSGHYRLHLFTEDPVYLKSALLGQRDVRDSDIVLDDPPKEMLELTIARAKGEIRGTVIRGGNNANSEADVKLIARGRDSRYVLKSVTANPAGEFWLAGIPPGKYDVVALDEVVRDSVFGPFEWAQVERRATQVEIGEFTTATIWVELSTVRYSLSPCAMTGSTADVPR
ncbi:MAG: carboxypeptidase-like regulatory domain-containing protein [Acidobacteriales bacterium]|nr:carboxypeptidase-like regulatory domain-containing protein [Terriglobales bacterium]